MRWGGRGGGGGRGRTSMNIKPLTSDTRAGQKNREGKKSEPRQGSFAFFLDANNAAARRKNTERGAVGAGLRERGGG